MECPLGDTNRYGFIICFWEDKVKSLPFGVLFFLSVVVCSVSIHAGPIGSCAKLRSFTLNFRTGGDDLRGNSEVIVWLLTTSGSVELQHVWGGFGNNSSHSRTVTFQNPNWNVDSCSVTGVKVRMVSHPAWHETADNWNMDGFAIHGYSESGDYKYYLEANGAPVKRFTGSDQWWQKRE